ncbi:hypothetical protein ABC628_10825 [Lentilactobacillus otakiensis]|uniref:hypothetical protein n=1 Tax=Lentilactobacillus otakiensis TaxID=481720 RepID=UPI0031CEE496
MIYKMENRNLTFRKIVLAIIVGTVILILGAFAFNKKVFAADQATFSSPFNLSDSIDSNHTYTSQEAIHFSFNPVCKIKLEI